MMSNHRESVPQALGVVRGLILSCFLIRYFDVAESAGQGDTLWIVVLWLITLILTVGLAVKWPVQLWRPGWLDWGVGLLVAGQLLSAIVVVATSGDKRTAVNLAWEWVGIGVAWLMLRQQSMQPAFRRELVAGLLATGTIVALLGLYQHYVEFPQLAAQYGPLFDRLKQADGTEAVRIRQQLLADQIPIDGPAIVLFEKRLRDSREALGPYALANTLGGFLAGWLVMTLGVVAVAWPLAGNVSRRRQLLWWIPMLICLGWCLLLTKSRTAWIGTGLGSGLIGLCSKWSKLTRGHFLVGGAALLVVLTLSWVLSQIGGLDLQVLTEAPKSLQYRLHYWAGTWPMIRDHAWTGVGLGQFRSNYLFYKLPAASEEIADPHNLFLEVAANSGLIAWIGLAVFCLGLKMTFSSRSIVAPEQVEVCPVIPRVVTCTATLSWLALLVTGANDRLLIMLPAAVALMWWLRRLIRSSIPNDRGFQLGAGAGAFALVVHLLGAGGIGMPAVTLMVLGLAALAASNKETSVPVPRRIPAYFSMGLSLVALGLIVLLCVSSLLPTRSLQAKMLAGDNLVRKGLLEAADAEYSAAARADDWSPDPWRRRAELAFRQVEADHFRSNDSFQKTVNHLREAVKRDPLGFADVRRLGECWISRWRTSRQLSDAEEAVQAFEIAWSKYPTNALIMSELAFANEAAGAMEVSTRIASQALKQDQVNRKWGHMDRYLPDPTRERLEALTIGK